MITFLAVQNKDSGKAYVEALLSAGYGQVGKLSLADFLLYDVERPNRHESYREYLANHCGFIYPHAPYSSYFHWDGIYSPLPVECNFVVAPGAKRALESIHYPYRVEVAGFSHCTTKPFVPTSGRKALLIVPRPMNGGRYVCEELHTGLRNVFSFLMLHAGEFEQITVQHTPDHWEKLGLPPYGKFEYTTNDPRHETYPAQYITDLVDQHDLVFGIGTAAYIALARGKPTIMWGNDLTPRTSSHLAQHAENYMNDLRYPLDFEKMSLDEIMEATQTESPAVTRWKAENIGDNFHADKVLQIVNESLTAARRYQSLPVVKPATGKSRSEIKFYATENRDHDGLFIQALLGAGFTRVNKPAEADFLFHDSVHPEIRDFLSKNPYFPNFITPHTPQSWFLWDGIQPIRYTCCNFVSGEAAVRGMAAYGYPYRVEAIGFTRCQVREFVPTRGADLLIIPGHPDRRGKYATPGYMEIILPTLERILQDRDCFGKISLLWCETRIDPEFMEKMKRAGFRWVYIDPFTDPAPLVHVMEEIEQADLVMGCGTAGCVSVAMGKPTVFFSEVGVPYSPPRAAQNSHLYLGQLRFPLMAESMTMEEILAVRTAPHPKTEYWKQQNIGGDFNAEKVVSVVQECLL